MAKKNTKKAYEMTEAEFVALVNEWKAAESYTTNDERNHYFELLYTLRDALEIQSDGYAMGRGRMASEKTAIFLRQHSAESIHRSWVKRAIKKGKRVA